MPRVRLPFFFFSAVEESHDPLARCAMLCDTRLTASPALARNFCRVLSLSLRWRRHSTVGEAIDIATRMRAKHTILTHFSSRFEKRVPDVRAYGTRGAKVSCAVDGMQVPLARLPLLPAVSLKMTDLLAQEYGEVEDGADSD